MKPTTLALKAAEKALDKGAQAVEIIDLRSKVDYTDFLVLCSGTSTRHVTALAEAIEDYKTVLRLFPDTRSAKKAKQRLGEIENQSETHNNLEGNLI